MTTSFTARNAPSRRSLLPTGRRRHGVLAAGVLVALTTCLLVRGAGAGREVRPLDGTWRIVFDPMNEGEDLGWVHAGSFPAQRARDIEVPGCWELTEKDYEGVAFYRRDFTAPAAWAGKVVRLQFDAVNFRAEVWLNDVAVGVHEGGFTPFEFRVDDLLRPDGTNTLILRVLGPILLQDKRVDGMGPMETPQWRGAITGGIWQSVRLVATGPTYVHDVFIQPEVAPKAATFAVELEHAGSRGEEAVIEVVVRPDNSAGPAMAHLRRSIRVQPGVNRLHARIELPEARLWSPDHPHLHQAELVVRRRGVVSDRWTTKFGLRQFTVKGRRFMLNGKPFPLKATFFEGLYPRRLAYPDSPEMVLREIRLAKEAGFNMIRPWRKPPPPMWLDLADELGVLTVGSLAIECMDFPAESADLPRWVANEVRETIRRDRNRACVVQWELFNELKRPVLKRLLRPTALLARDLDPTRLILDESGGWAQGANLYLPGQREPIHFNDIHDYPGQQINEQVYEKLLLAGRKTHEEMRALGLDGRLPGRNVVPGIMTFFSELGYGSLPDLVDNNRRFAEEGNPLAPPTVYHRRLAEQHRRALRESGCDAVYPDLRRFCLAEQQLHGRANRRMIEAVRCNPAVAGYCIHALTAGDWILGAGLLDLWRQPKTLAYTETREANRPRILSLRIRPRNVYAAEGTRIEVTGVNDASPLTGQLEVRVLSPSSETVWETRRPGDFASGITRFLDERLDTAGLQGTLTVVARFHDQNEAVTVTNRLRCDVFTAAQLEPPRGPIAVVDPVGTLKGFLRARGVAWTEFRSGASPDVPVLVARTVAANPAQRRRFEELADFIHAGGSVAYLGGGGPRVPWGRAGEASDLLPVRLQIKRAVGNWICIPRLVKDHPVFDGLPVNGMMGPVYENVWPQATLLNAGGQVLAASIGYDWFPDYDRTKRHYAGPGDVWWGADLAVVPHGRGRCVVSQLRLVENLGRDPVADLILFNLIRWMRATASPAGSN